MNFKFIINATNSFKLNVAPRIGVTQGKFFDSGSVVEDQGTIDPADDISFLRPSKNWLRPHAGAGVGMTWLFWRNLGLTLQATYDIIIGDENMHRVTVRGGMMFIL